MAPLRYAAKFDHIIILILQRVFVVFLALSAIVGASVLRKQGDQVMGKENEYAIGGLSNNPERHNIEKRSPQGIFLQKVVVAKMLGLWGVQFGIQQLLQG